MNAILYVALAARQSRGLNDSSGQLLVAPGLANTRASFTGIGTQEV